MGTVDAVHGGVALEHMPAKANTALWQSRHATRGAKALFRAAMLADLATASYAVGAEEDSRLERHGRGVHSSDDDDVCGEALGAGDGAVPARAGASGGDVGAMCSS